MINVMQGVYLVKEVLIIVLIALQHVQTVLIILSVILILRAFICHLLVQIKLVQMMPQLVQTNLHVPRIVIFGMELLVKLLLVLILREIV